MSMFMKIHAGTVTHEACQNAGGGIATGRRNVFVLEGGHLLQIGDVMSIKNSETNPAIIVQ